MDRRDIAVITGEVDFSFESGGIGEECQTPEGKVQDRRGAEFGPAAQINDLFPGKKWR